MFGAMGINSIEFADDDGNVLDSIEAKKPKTLTVEFPKMGGGTVEITAGDRIRYAQLKDGEMGVVNEGTVINVSKNNYTPNTEAYDVPTQQDDGGIALILAPLKGYSWTMIFEKVSA
jgi:hypothetical protein